MVKVGTNGLLVPPMGCRLEYELGRDTGFWKGRGWQFGQLQSTKMFFPSL